MWPLKITNHLHLLHYNRRLHHRSNLHAGIHCCSHHLHRRCSRLENSLSVVSFSIDVAGFTYHGRRRRHHRRHAPRLCRRECYDHRIFEMKSALHISNSLRFSLTQRYSSQQSPGQQRPRQRSARNRSRDCDRCRGLSPQPVSHSALRTKGGKIFPSILYRESGLRARTASSTWPNSSNLPRKVWSSVCHARPLDMRISRLQDKRARGGRWSHHNQALNYPMNNLAIITWSAPVGTESK